MDQLLTEIGDRIRRRRKQLGLTQEDLSNRTDVTTQTISNAELGLKGMRPDTIIRICRALEISTDYLLLGEISDTDKSLFSDRLATLTPNQMKHLISIVDSYLTAIQEKEAEEPIDDSAPTPLFFCFFRAIPYGCSFLVFILYGKPPLC